MFPWDELGLEPTGDATLIRRAYAVRLKRTRPEDDPAGFTRLRAAYEAALRLSEQIAAQTASPADAEETDFADDDDEWEDDEEDESSAELEQAEADDADPAERGHEPPDHQLAQALAARRRARAEAASAGMLEKQQPLVDHELARRVAARRRAAETDEKPSDRRIARPEPAKTNQAADEASVLTELPPAAQVAIREIVAALDRKANIEAARYLIDALDRHLLPLRVEFQLKERLAVALLADRAVSTEQLRSIAEAIGWYDRKLVPRQNSPEARLCDRIEAELTAELAREAAERDRAAAESARLRAISARPASFRDLLRVLGYSVLFLMAISFVLALLGPIPVPKPVGQPAHHTGQQSGSATGDRTNTAKPASPTAELAQNEVPLEIDLDKLPTGGRVTDAAAGLWLDDLKKRAAGGSRRAQLRLGVAYLTGSAGAKDPYAATLWLRRAADQNDPQALCALGVLNLAGAGKDPAAAKALLLQSAQLDFAPAQFLLARLLVGDEGVPADQPAALAWLKRAALARYVPAMAMLAMYYGRGIGTEIDLIKAAAWDRAAAAAGDPTAMYDYGVAAARGKGLRQNPEEGYRWLALAIRAPADAAERAATASVSSELPFSLEALPEPDISGKAKTALASITGKLPADRRMAIDEELKAWRPTMPAPPEIDAQ